MRIGEIVRCRDTGKIGIVTHQHWDHRESGWEDWEVEVLFYDGGATIHSWDLERI